MGHHSKYIARRFIKQFDTSAVMKANKLCKLLLLLLIIVSVEHLFNTILNKPTLLPEWYEEASRYEEKRCDNSCTKKKLDDTSSELVGSVTKIIDGDTIQLLLDDTPMVFRRISCRLRGIDTPELRRSRCCIEKCLAKIAKEFVESLIPKGSVVKLLSPAKGKYFRLIANISTEKGDLSNILEQIGLAVKYNGYGKRYDWCAKPYQVNTAQLIRDRCDICVSKTLI